MLVFSTQLSDRYSPLHCCPSPLISDSTLPPSLCEKVYFIVYIRIQYVRWDRVWGYGPQTEKHLLQSPFTGQVFRLQHLNLPSMSLFVLRMKRSRRGFSPLGQQPGDLQPEEPKHQPQVRENHLHTVLLYTFLQCTVRVAVIM
jgi:hypothetical protein